MLHDLAHVRRELFSINGPDETALMNGGQESRILFIDLFCLLYVPKDALVYRDKTVLTCILCILCILWQIFNILMNVNYFDL